MEQTPFQTVGPISPAQPLAWRTMHTFRRELSIVDNQLANTLPRPISVIAPHQSGRTTFANQLEHELEDDPRVTRCIRVNLELFGTAENQRDFIISIAGELSQYCDLSDEINGLDERQFLISVLSAICDMADGYVLLILDGVESLPEKISAILFRYLRSIDALHTSGRLANLTFITLSTMPPMLEEGSQISPFNVAIEVYLNDLTVAESKEFLLGAFGKLKRVSISDEAAEYLAHRTGGHLALMQEFCQRILARVDVTPELYRHVSISMVAGEIARSFQRIPPCVTHLTHLDTLPIEAGDVIKELTSRSRLSFAFTQGTPALLSRGIAKRCNTSGSIIFRSQVVAEHVMASHCRLDNATLPADLECFEYRLLEMPPIIALILENCTEAELRVRSQIKVEGYRGLGDLTGLFFGYLDEITVDMESISSFCRLMDADRIPGRNAVLSLVSKVHANWLLLDLSSAKRSE